MRVVLIAQIPPAVEGLTRLLRGLGHEPVALICTREHAERYGNQFDALVRAAPEEFDVLIPAQRSGIAPLLRVYEPDLLLCAGFPWKIPPDALAVPRLGAMNGHPGLLPEYRGPSPVAWAIRNGEAEVGFTFHRMDADLDTGAVLAQGTAPLDDEHSWEELTPKLIGLVAELFPVALARIEVGDPGDRSERGGTTPSSSPSTRRSIGPDRWKRSTARFKPGALPQPRRALAALLPNSTVRRFACCA